MERKYTADIVINKERLSDGSNVFVVYCSNLGISSQGSTTEEAIKNIKESIDLYLEEMPEAFDQLNESVEPPIFSFVEIKRPVKNA
tara:strand:+ start:260 stop:517 length:258 start_codon:yes stop_codon:yes gene_type:complete